MAKSLSESQISDLSIIFDDNVRSVLTVIQGYKSEEENGQIILPIFNIFPNWGELGLDPEGNWWFFSNANFLRIPITDFSTFLTEYCKLSPHEREMSVDEIDVEYAKTLLDRIKGAGEHYNQVFQKPREIQ